MDNTPTNTSIQKSQIRHQQTDPKMPQPRLTLPHVVDIPASLDLLREIMPRRIPPIEIPKKLKTHPITPSVSPGLS